MNKNNNLTQKIDQIVDWIVNSKHLVAFTGAGISTESGIPDFRGPDGVWTRRDKGLPPPKMKKSWHEKTKSRSEMHRFCESGDNRLEI